MAAAKKAKATFIAEVPANLKDEAKKDARRFNKSLDGIGEVILRHWFDLPVQMRAKFYERLPKKILGRPL